MDSFSPEERSRIMRRVKGADTTPEKRVRSCLHRLGLRFRLHRRDLPGCPDIVLPRHKTVVLVNGCFWHRHAGCKRATMPASNVAYWECKFARTVQRDAANRRKLKKLGWRVLVVWECQTRRPEALEKRLRRHFMPMEKRGKLP